MEQIIFTGAQGTGKTTMLEELKKDSKFKNYKFITEIVRKLASQKIPINKESTFITQLLVGNKYFELFTLEQNNFISDRGLIDVLAYTLYILKNSTVFTKRQELIFLTDYQEKLISLVHQKSKIFYFPIEFKVISDNFRSSDEIYRKEIDILIKRVLENFHLPYITVTGTHEQRKNIILTNL